jgi:hypothetical protein
MPVVPFAVDQSDVAGLAAQARPHRSELQELKFWNFGVVSLSTTSALFESKRRPIPGGVFAFDRHCEPTGRANARPDERNSARAEMTGSAKQSRVAQGASWIASSLCSSQ